MMDLTALLAQAGANDVEWEDPNLPGRTIWLRSARPVHCTAETPVLFVHHGVGRNGGDYRDYWLPLVDEADVLVVAPEFPDEDFPKGSWYNFGNLLDQDGVANPRAQWTYNIDERVFAELRKQGLTGRDRYGVFGHSAGSQFVHRMLTLGFRGQVAAAVVANAGTYAMPNLDDAWPYGFAGTDVDERGLRDMLEFRLTVMAGTADIDASSPNFPKEEMAMLQGRTRYERAHTYIAAARTAAKNYDIKCAWTIVDVEGVGHDGCRMSAAAAPILSAALHA
jgi:poly(3-hydroxybutyrate) depolymerase